MVDRLGVDDPGICIRFSVGLGTLRLSMVTRPALGSRHPAVLRVSVLVESDVVLNSCSCSLSLCENRGSRSSVGEGSGYLDYDANSV